MKKLLPVLAFSLLCAVSAKVQAATTYLTGTFNHTYGSASADSTVVATIGFDSDYYNNTFLPLFSTRTDWQFNIGGPDVTSLSYTINNTGIPGMDGTYHVDLTQYGYELFIADNYNSSFNPLRFSFWDYGQGLWANSLGQFVIYNNTYAMTSSSTAVPEPSTYGLIGLGALGIAMLARRKKTA